MNHIFKTVFNKSSGTFVAVPEFAKGRVKTSGHARRPNNDAVTSEGLGKAVKIAKLSFMSAVVMLLTGQAAFALPTGGVFVGGAGSITTSGSTMDITASGPGTGADAVVGGNGKAAVINWAGSGGNPGFQVLSGEKVYFIRNNQSIDAWINIDTSGQASLINGVVSAVNMAYDIGGSYGDRPIILINPNGMSIGSGATIDPSFAGISGTFNPTDGSATLNNAPITVDPAFAIEPGNGASSVVVQAAAPDGSGLSDNTLPFAPVDSDWGPLSVNLRSNGAPSAVKLTLPADSSESVTAGDFGSGAINVAIDLTNANNSAFTYNDTQGTSGQITTLTSSVTDGADANLPGQTLQVINPYQLDLSTQNLNLQNVKLTTGYDMTLNASGTLDITNSDVESQGNGITSNTGTLNVASSYLYGGNYSSLFQAKDASFDSTAVVVDGGLSINASNSLSLTNGNVFQNNSSAFNDGFSSLSIAGITNTDGTNIVNDIGGEGVLYGFNNPTSTAVLSDTIESPLFIGLSSGNGGLEITQNMSPQGDLYLQSSGNVTIDPNVSLTTGINNTIGILSGGLADIEGSISAGAASIVGGDVLVGANSTIQTNGVNNGTPPSQSLIISATTDPNNSILFGPPICGECNSQQMPYQAPTTGSGTVTINGDLDSLNGANGNSGGTMVVGQGSVTINGAVNSDQSNWIEGGDVTVASTGTLTANGDPYGNGGNYIYTASDPTGALPSSLNCPSCYPNATGSFDDNTTSSTGGGTVTIDGSVTSNNETYDNIVADHGVSITGSITASAAGTMGEPPGTPNIEIVAGATDPSGIGNNIAQSSNGTDTISMNGATLNADGEIFMQSADGISMTGSTLNAGSNTLLTGGTLYEDSGSSVTANGSVYANANGAPGNTLLGGLVDIAGALTNNNASAVTDIAGGDVTVESTGAIADNSTGGVQINATSSTQGYSNVPSYSILGGTNQCASGYGGYGGSVPVGNGTVTISGKITSNATDGGGVYAYGDTSLIQDASSTISVSSPDASGTGWSADLESGGDTTINGLVQSSDPFGDYISGANSVTIGSTAHIQSVNGSIALYGTTTQQPNGSGGYVTVGSPGSLAWKAGNKETSTGGVITDTGLSVSGSANSDNTVTSGNAAVATSVINISSPAINSSGWLDAGQSAPNPAPVITQLFIDPVNGSSVYGQVPVFAYSLVDANGNVVSLSGASLAGSATYSGAPNAQSNVGTYSYSYNGGLSLTGANASQYSLSGFATPSSWQITPASLIIGGLSASNKVYDGNTSAVINGGALSGVVNGDTVAALSSGTFATKNVGTGIDVNVNTTITGTGSGNYVLSNPSNTIKADITPKPITETATADNKVYDGNTVAVVSSITPNGVIAGDNVTFGYKDANFDTPDVGTGKLVTVDGITSSGADAGNYIVDPIALAHADITAPAPAPTPDPVPVPVVKPPVEPPLPVMNKTPETSPHPAVNKTPETTPPPAVVVAPVDIVVSTESNIAVTHGGDSIAPATMVGNTLVLNIGNNQKPLQIDASSAASSSASPSSNSGSEVTDDPATESHRGKKARD